MEHTKGKWQGNPTENKLSNVQKRKPTRRTRRKGQGNPKKNKLSNVLKNKPTKPYNINVFSLIAVPKIKKLAFHPNAIEKFDVDSLNILGIPIHGTPILSVRPKDKDKFRSTTENLFPGVKDILHQRGFDLNKLKTVATAKKGDDFIYSLKLRVRATVLCIMGTYIIPSPSSGFLSLIYGEFVKNTEDINYAWGEAVMVEMHHALGRYKTTYKNSPKEAGHCIKGCQVALMPIRCGGSRSIPVDLWMGIKIYRDRSRRLLGLSQSTYIVKVLKRFSMQESKRGFIPMSHGTSLSKTQCPTAREEKERMDKIPYTSAIGSILYAMIFTRPDISYALSITSRYQSNPGEAHWTAVKNILKYLRRTKDTFLVYGGEEELVARGYFNANFQTDRDDFRSQSGEVDGVHAGVVLVVAAGDDNDPVKRKIRVCVINGSLERSRD
ncbi:transposon Pol polyprotein [Senna tora]|uniref:Transposon Pol polyprotein n=1 Tax=Senna tora TaxID=362788 RepID=A0A834SVQ1_9FABA|nr:transposon Pol polyprotein [Senna tora]